MPTANELLYTEAGSFNRRISIQEQTTSKDAYGEPIVSWAESFRCWAQILPFTGQISGFTVKPAPDFAVAPVTINIRYQAGKNITNEMRAVHLTTGQVYRILYVANPETAQKIIQLACQVAT